MFDISIVIPCFNHGAYLLEALQSVEYFMSELKVEVIIVNDGSTDQLTIEILERLQKEGWIILNQQNLGLAEARNNGIKVSSGKNILPLDSDNLVIGEFVKKALDVFKKKTEIDIVYSDSIHFGEQEFYNEVGEFNPCRLINDNYIDACAIYRRQVWEEVGGYDKNMPVMGHEDWDFWVTALAKCKQFHYLSIPGFKYRVRANSMLRKVTIRGGDENRRYIYTKHNYQLFESIQMNYNPDPDSYKIRYFNLIKDLQNRPVMNIAKLLLGKQFT